MDLETLLASSLFDAYPGLATLLGLAVLAVLAWLANWLTRWLTRHVLIRGLQRIAHLLGRGPDNLIGRYKVAERLANAVPALVVQAGVGLVPHLPQAAASLIRMLAQAFVFLALARAASAALDVVNELYKRLPDACSKPIKGYLQLVKIVLYIVCALAIFGTFLERDVLTLLAGLGAMAAVLMLIFQNTILSLVASVQVTSYDMVRVGDWIEMPSLNADGDVIDISLHTVTVQNWDKTITTIPTNRLVTDTFRNWRGMTESGGRRIKRALLIDQTSVRFLTDEERNQMHRFLLIDRYIAEKQRELEEWNRKLAEHGREPVNQRRITNIGTFRAYVDQYLRQHPKINQNMTLLVRQLDPQPTGLPLEIYCFTADIAWGAYEGIQADIFDHLLAILPEFGLRVFQEPSGADWRALAAQAVTADPRT